MRLFNTCSVASNGRRICLGFLLLFCWQQLAWAQSIPGITEPATGAKPLPAAEIIETDEADRPSDAQIKTRLTEIYANLPGLTAVSVDVNQGVILLSGTVDDSKLQESADQLASRIAGAVTVINQISRDRTLTSRLQAALRSAETQFKDLAGNAPLLLLALIVIALAIFLARLLGKAEQLFDRMAINWFVRDMLRQGLQLAIFLFGVVIALKLLDATALLGSLLGAVGIVGLAIGFATRDTVENYIASMLLSMRQPFQREDHINIEGIEGKVLRLTPRATILMSLDGNHLRVPNAKVYKATITNYTRNPLRRFEFQVGVDTEVDLSLPRALAVKTVTELPGVLDSPPALCLVQQLGDSSIILKVLGWIDQRENDFLKTRSEAQQRVKEAFDEAGIIMPEPIYNVNLRQQKQISAKQTEPTESETVQSAAKAELETELLTELESGIEAGADTQPDKAVEEQMRQERRSSADEDLLSNNAPVE